MINQGDLTRVRKAFRALDATTSTRVLSTAARAGGLIIETSAKQKVPRITSTLMRSIHTEVTSASQNSAVAVVGTDVEYGPHVEFGTRARVIRPRNARALRFKIGGRVVFAKFVRHPGTRAKPFLRPAFDENKDKVHREVVDVIWHQVERMAA